MSINKDIKKYKILNTILRETILLEKQLSHQEIEDLLSSGEKRVKKIITDIYGNGEPLPSDILNNTIIREVINSINTNTLYNNLPYLVMKGEIVTKENNKLNLYIIYLLLDKSLPPWKRQNYIYEIISNKFNIDEWQTLGNSYTIPKINKDKKIIIKYNNNEINLNPELIGILKNGRREIKISDISYYYFDEKSNTLIFINAKPIKHVTKENVPIGSSVDSLSLETTFQFQLKYAYWLLFNNNIDINDFTFVGKGIKINKTTLKNIIDNILQMSKSENNNIELQYLKDKDNDNEYFKSLEQFLNYIKVNKINDEYIILDFSKEIDEFPQNILVQYRLLKSIKKQINSKKIYIVSENIFKMVKLNDNEKNILLENIVEIGKKYEKIKKVNGKDVDNIIKDIDENKKSIKHILNNINIPKLTLSPIQKLYFQLLSIDKNQISSGDLYIIVEDNENEISIDEYITIQNDVIEVNNSFDYNNSPITKIYPVSYKKLEGQRLGKFTLNDDIKSKRKGNISVDEIDKQFSLSISELYKKYFTTISLGEFKTFIKNLREIIKTMTKNNDFNTLKQIEDIIKNKIDKINNNIEQQDKKQEKELIELIKSSIDQLNNNQEISRIDILFRKVLSDLDKSINETISEIYDNKIKKIIESLLTLILLLDSLEDFINTINIKDDKVTLESLNKLDLIINYLNLLESNLSKVINDIDSKYLGKLNNILNEISLFENNDNIKKLINEIKKSINNINKKIFSSLVQTLYQYLYILSIDNLVVQTEIILDIINRQLKLNVKVTYKNYILKFINSYFITQDFGTGELPYLFDKEFVQNISDDSALYIDENDNKKSRQQISMYADIIKLTNFKIVYNDSNNIQIETENESDKNLKNFELIVNNAYEKVLDFITQINQNKQNKSYDLTIDDIDLLVSSLNSIKTDLETITENFTISSTFVITIVFNTLNSNNNKKIEISFLFRDFGSSLTSELQDFRIIRS